MHRSIRPLNDAMRCGEMVPIFYRIGSHCLPVMLTPIGCQHEYMLQNIETFAPNDGSWVTQLKATDLRALRAKALVIMVKRARRSLLPAFIFRNETIDSIKLTKVTISVVE